MSEPMSPERRALLDALTVERFTPYQPPTPEPPRALRLIHDAQPLTPAQQRRRKTA